MPVEALGANAGAEVMGASPVMRPLATLAIAEEQYQSCSSEIPGASGSMAKSARKIPVREKTTLHDDRNGRDPLPVESDALRSELIQSLGQEWLNTKNEWLHFKTPDEVIGTAEEERLRDIVRSILVAALS